MLLHLPQVAAVRLLASIATAAKMLD